ncbi:hypothetical protein JTB14_017374 [Gonioctena quinquepunctata]|nr:hypothetical protein JTB14_017374 [Gonioctena quinquepunctata]
MRPWNAYSATNRYLNSDSAVKYYYLSYPSYGYNHSYSLNLPSDPYSPKAYRWYYSWPREYYSYWPYYRSYLTSYLKNYYLSSYWPSSSYWSSYLPYYRSLDYDISKLENKIDNLSVSTESRLLARCSFH